MTTYGMVAALLLSQAAPATPTPPPAAPQGAPATATVASPPLQAAPAPVLTLDEALREAEAKNLDLKAARARLDQARTLSAKAWSFYLPQVTAGGTFTHNNVPDVTIGFPTAYAIRDCTPGAAGATVACPAGPPPPASTPGGPTPYALIPTAIEQAVIQKQNQLGAQIQVTQALLAPQAWYGIRSAGTGEEVAAEQVENGRRQILFGAAQAYYAAAGLKQVVAIQERQLLIARDHERDAKVRYDAGTTPKVTLLRAEIDRARAEQDLKRAQNAFLSAETALATLLDRKAVDFDVAVPAPPQLPPDPDALERDAVKQRPDVRAAQAGVLLGEEGRDGVYARYAPALGAFARLQWANITGFTGKETSWAVGLSATWTLFDGGLREADLRDYQARVREAEASRAAAEARALDEVRRARLDLDSAVANREKAKEQLSLARENQKLVDVNYKAGAATYLEVTDANAALLSAELTQVSESLNADLAVLRLLQAAGAFQAR